jgi:IS30 family transposase
MSVKKQRAFRHLNQKDREQIDVLCRKGYTCADIAKQVGCHTSTVWREINRNSSVQHDVYIAHTAQSKTLERRSRCAKKSKFDDPIIVNYITEKIKLEWSPEQIAGRLEKDYPRLSISHEAIYDYLYSLADPLRKQLIVCLRRHHPARKKRSKFRAIRKTKILNRVGIEDRPSIVNERIQPGHWETDTLVCKSNTVAIDSTVERVSRYVKLSKLNRKNAYNKAQSVIQNLSEFRPEFRRTITFDNGTENASHLMISQAIQIKSYFAHPYHSWERGTNENTNGLIRQYIPKGTDLRFVSDEQLKTIEFKLNNRPRKCLNYDTPYEVARSFGAFIT